MKAPILRIASVLLAAAVAGPAAAQTAAPFPSRPVTFIIPYPPGGAADIVGRLLSDRLSQIWKQPVVIQNKGGAGGVLGLNGMLQARPDGYTMGLTTASVTLTLAQMKTPSFQLLRDFQPVSLVLTAPMVLVAHKDVPVSNARELVAYAKSSPDKLFYGGTGQGGLGNLAGELFLKQTGGSMTYVPFQGGAQSMASVVAGQTPMAFNDVGTARQFLNSGMVKGLVVASPKRTRLLPDVDSLGDIGIHNIDIKASHGILVPAGTPPEIVREISTRVREILAAPEVRERFDALGLEPVGSTPQEFAEFLKAEDLQFREGLRVANFQPLN